MVKHTHTISRQFGDEFFESVWSFCGISALKVKRFSNPGFFFKEEPINYFHDAFSTLPLPHQHEDENNLKTHHEKENLYSF